MTTQTQEMTMATTMTVGIMATMTKKLTRYEIQTKNDGNWETLETHNTYETEIAAQDDIEWFESGAGCFDPRDADDWKNGEYRIVEV